MVHQGCPSCQNYYERESDADAVRILLICLDPTITTCTLDTEVPYVLYKLPKC